MADPKPLGNGNSPYGAVPLWLKAKHADIEGFPYAEVPRSVAAPLIASGDAQDLNNCYAWQLGDFPAAQPPVVPPLTGLTATPSAASVVEGADTTVTIGKTPAGAANPTLTVTSSDETKATATVAGLVVTIHGVAAGTATITVHAGTITKDIVTTVTAATSAAPSADEPASVDETVVSLSQAPAPAPEASTKADNLSPAKRARKAAVK